MKNFNYDDSKFLEELFDGYEAEINEECLYEIRLHGNFRNVDGCSFNVDFQKELFNVLPKNIVTMGYRCRGCGTWLSNGPKSICNMCDENFGHDLASLDNDPNDKDAQEWVEYYSSRYNKELFLAFTTDSPVNLENIKDKFMSGKYINELYIWKATPDDDNIQCQSPARIYDDMYMIKECY